MAIINLVLIRRVKKIVILKSDLILISKLFYMNHICIFAMFLYQKYMIIQFRYLFRNFLKKCKKFSSEESNLNHKIQSLVC